ncbi:MAG: DivIVA domain-containing protein [Candidatus Phosphoribacter sp.]|nr:DivIVA domain-containing protein [Actinomycetales bacterium]
MTWVALAVAVVLVGLTVAAVLGRIDGGLGPATTSLAYVPLPLGQLEPEDVDDVRLDTALRGYRMDQVDEVLGRLTDELRSLHAQLSEARALAQSFVPPAAAAEDDGSPPLTQSPYHRPQE